MPESKPVLEVPSTPPGSKKSDPAVASFLIGTLAILVVVLPLFLGPPFPNWGAFIGIDGDEQFCIAGLVLSFIGVVLSMVTGLVARNKRLGRLGLVLGSAALLIALARVGMALLFAVAYGM